MTEVTKEGRTEVDVHQSDDKRMSSLRRFDTIPKCSGQTDSHLSLANTVQLQTKRKTQHFCTVL